MMEVAQRTEPFALEGARNRNGEYRCWLHVIDMPGSTVIEQFFPWPLTPGTGLDHKLLLSYWHMTRFNNWPAYWENFPAAMRPYRLSPGRGFWALGHFNKVDSKLFVPIPLEVLNAFT